MNIDFLNEILENDEISIIGESEMLKELVFQVCQEQEGFELIVGNYDYFDDYLMLSRIDNMLILESIVDEDGNYVLIESDMTWIDNDIFSDAFRKGQVNKIADYDGLVFLY